MARKPMNPHSTVIEVSFDYDHAKAKPAAVKKLAKEAFKAAVETAVPEAMKNLQAAMDAKFGAGTFSSKAAKLSISALAVPAPAAKPAAKTATKKAAGKAVKKAATKATTKKAAKKTAKTAATA